MMSNKNRRSKNGFGETHTHRDQLLLINDCSFTIVVTVVSSKTYLFPPFLGALTLWIVVGRSRRTFTLPEEDQNILMHGADFSVGLSFVCPCIPRFVLNADFD